MTPKIHDRVLYHPHPEDHMRQIGNQPLAAFVCGVIDDACVNLAIFGADGLVWSRTEVLYVGASAAPNGGRWCTPITDRDIGLIGLPVVADITRARP